MYAFAIIRASQKGCFTNDNELIGSVQATVNGKQMFVDSRRCIYIPNTVFSLDGVDHTVSYVKWNRDLNKAFVVTTEDKEIEAVVPEDFTPLTTGLYFGLVIKVGNDKKVRLFNPLAKLDLEKGTFTKRSGKVRDLKSLSNFFNEDGQADMVKLAGTMLANSTNLYRELVREFIRLDDQYSFVMEGEQDVHKGVIVKINNNEITFKVGDKEMTTNRYNVRV